MKLKKVKIRVYLINTRIKIIKKLMKAQKKKKKKNKMKTKIIVKKKKLKMVWKV